MPVKAEWPSASEKKAIFRLTIIVPIKPNKGAINKMANSAFLIKPYSRPIGYLPPKSGAARLPVSFAGRKT